ncbi:MAG: dihydroorotate dehydrogenase, partial [Calditrichaceae bacterium]
MRYIKPAIAIIIPVLILIMPGQWIPIDNISVVEQRLIAIFVMATLFWVLEPIPIFATSVLIISLELVMVSDSSFFLFSAPPDAV